jgi:hypothetical protein
MLKVAVSTQHSSTKSIECHGCHAWCRYITKDTRQRGLLSVPAIIGQLTQLFMGSFLVKWLRTLVKDDYED